jgi:hypothetical protein
MIFNFLSVCEYFLVATGVEAGAAEPQPTAASDNESDWLKDSDEVRDYADQFPDLDGPDSPGRINNRNLEVLEAVLKVNQNVSTKQIFIFYQILFHIRILFVCPQGQCKKQLQWGLIEYHAWYHMIYMISYYDIIFVLWYHIWYDMISYDTILHIWYHCMTSQ